MCTHQCNDINDVCLCLLVVCTNTQAAVNTSRRFGKKKAFFGKFFICSGLWIFSMPVISAIAYAVTEWAREVQCSIQSNVLLPVNAILL